MQVETPLFSLGHCVATPGAINALRNANEKAATFFRRHVLGDWGDIDEHDQNVNADALRDGERLMSVYTTGRGERIWIITEADRSATTVLLPEEY